MLRSRKFFGARSAADPSRSWTIPSESGNSNRASSIIQTASVIANDLLCREHYRLTFRVDAFAEAVPGQFVHLRPEGDSSGGHHSWESDTRLQPDGGATGSLSPMLRRAFSIAGLQRRPDGVNVDVIYRVVGAATRWMESLVVEQRFNVLGPLGNGFTISNRKPAAWLVAGGVGLPPTLWLVEALHKAGKRTIAFYGARTADLLAVTLDPSVSPACDAARATLCCHEFARSDAAAVISTDDGSLGYHGHIGSAMAIYHEADPVPSDELVVYTCGPEPMMRFVARYCVVRGIECYVCMERSMACGLGLCQSCVTAVQDDADPDGWRYRLCCTEGPVFDAAAIIWDPVGSA